MGTIKKITCAAMAAMIAAAVCMTAFAETETQASTQTETQVSTQTETKASSQTETQTSSQAETQAQQQAQTNTVTLDPQWKYADFSQIHTGAAVLYKAETDRKNITIGVNAGHGTNGGASVKTYCHPDKTPKVTGGSTAAGSIKATAVSGGMTFNDGTPESKVTLAQAKVLKDALLAEGYDVLMIRDGDDVQLDNVARTVICNNAADCHIAIHWDGDSRTSDKGAFYISVPDGIKNLETVAATWQKSEALGEDVVAGLKAAGCKICGNGSMDVDLTQTSYSTVPSIDLELGNQCSDHSDAALKKNASGIVAGINTYFGAKQ